MSYHSGEPFDVAICDCQAGQFWRMEGGEFVRQRLGLQPAHQVALLEDFDGDVMTPVPPDRAAFIEAGKTAKRAKL